MLSFRSFIRKDILNQLNIISRNLSKSANITKLNKTTKTTNSTKSAKLTKPDKNTTITKCCKHKTCKCSADTSSQVNDLVSREKQIDHHSLTWILTLMDKDRLKLTKDQLVDYYGHSGGSWNWTNYQIKIIRRRDLIIGSTKQMDH
jgi:hypothetical protein